MAQSNYRTKVLATDNKVVNSLHPALENLKERLSSPRLKATSTISTYLQTSARFLSSLGEDREPTDSDFRRYFVRRRQQGISERTLLKEFAHLKKLAIANSWPWPFGADGTSAMTPQKKTRTKAFAIVNKTASRLHPALQNLVERLSSPKLRAPGTLSSYLITGSNFLSGLKDKQSPTDSDFRRYFIRRRKEGISERTLLKEFAILKKLAIANSWPWPFEKEDAPYPEDKKKLPVLLQAEVDQMINARAKLTNTERFYLAVATTWLVRREELSRIKKRDYDGETFIIHTAKHGKTAKHLIPDVLKPIFADYRPKEHNPSALSLMFRRICVKAGLKDKKGFGWHGIRYALDTLLKEVSLPQNRLSSSLLNDYAHWKTSSSNHFGGQDMTEHYRRPEVIYTEPYGIDKVIYAIHPFLHLWSKKR